jgi:16S rRNA (adenine1518-N6/adenine1519-N6)-dimethyltransferase
VQTLAQIKAMLAERGVRPRHALGQNFLIDHNLLKRLIEDAAPPPHSLVLEVGPGTGTLTETLLARGLRVIACELDPTLADVVTQRITELGYAERFRLIRGDCLDPGKRVSRELISAIGDEPFSLIANLPYAAATPLMIALLIDHPHCRTMAVTIQREVIDRLAARPNTKDYGALSIIAQSLATITPLAKLPPECFWPRPQVTSGMVLLTRRPDPLTRQPRELAAFCHTLFSKRRKQLGAILGRTAPLPDGIDPAQRPESLTPQQIIATMELQPSSNDEG